MTSGQPEHSEGIPNAAVHISELADGLSSDDFWVRMITVWIIIELAPKRALFRMIMHSSQHCQVVNCPEFLELGM